MRGLRFDWRWVGVIAVLVVLTNSSRLPPLLTALVVGAAGIWLLYTGWQAWVREGGPPERSRVTYWRGQRIELAPPRRGPALPQMRAIGPAVLYFILGIVLLLAAGVIGLRGVGL